MTNNKSNIHVAAIGFTLLSVIGCTTTSHSNRDLIPQGELLEEFRDDVIFTLEYDGAELFGATIPTFEQLCSSDNHELVLGLIRKLEGSQSVSANTLLESLAALEGNNIAWSLYDGFDEISSSMAVDDLNLLLMKSTAIQSVTIPFPETGYIIRYKIELTECGYNYSIGERGHATEAVGEPLSESERRETFRGRSKQFWNDKLKKLGIRKP